MSLTPEMVEARRRLFEDFEFYAAHVVKIRTKEQKIVPLVLNRAQKRILEVAARQLTTRGYIRIILLKGRQMGSSTFVEAFLYWWVSQRQAQKALVVAHDAPATATIFDMTKRIHDKAPDIMRPETRYAGRRELYFSRLDSGYRIATAGGDGIVRGDTVTAAHLSEVAWWPVNSAAANYSGLMDAIPLIAGTVVFEESTANGFNLFWEHWDAASRGESAFEAVFLPWWWDDGYRVDPGPDFERTPDEDHLVELYGLDDAQLRFRRIKIAEKGADLFKQEYPCCAEEAFLTSGRPVFHPEKVAEAIKNRRQPIARKSLRGTGKVRKDGLPVLEWEDDPIGELLCYLPHSEHETYTIGADVGGGVRKDFSVAQVLDSSRRQVAVWASDRHDPDLFGTVLAHLGVYFNKAQVCCERNNHGILTNRVLHVDWAYPNLYQETVYDKITDTETDVVGFTTSEKSKPLVIDKARAEFRDGELEVYDEDTLHEMQRFIINEKLKMEAEKGHHDDRVIALALANHINDGPWKPYVADEGMFTKANDE